MLLEARCPRCGTWCVGGQVLRVHNQATTEGGQFEAVLYRCPQCTSPQDEGVGKTEFVITPDGSLLVVVDGPSEIA